MKKDKFEGVALTLEEARSQARAKAPEGFSVLQESVDSPGTPVIVRGLGPTSKAALAAAKHKAPEGWRTVTGKQIAKALTRTIFLTASDEADAGSQARASLGRNSSIAHLKLLTAGKRGFLGMGRTPNQYEVGIRELAEVELTFTVAAKVSVTAADAHWLRLAGMNQIGGPWHGVFTTKSGASVMEEKNPLSYSSLSAGEWLWFLYTFRHGAAEPDGIPIIVTDVACFWLRFPIDVREPFRDGYNGSYVIRPEIVRYLVRDGTYKDWQDGFLAINRWFKSPDSGWSHQWSRKPPRVSDFVMLGKNENWISSSVSSEMLLQAKPYVHDEVAVVTGQAEPSKGLLHGEARYTGFKCSYCGCDFPPDKRGGFLDDLATDKGTRCPECGRFYCGGCRLTQIPPEFRCQCGHRIN
jgi:DNA-directed RNA polymerase subunit RPC12/RpoP